MKIGFQEISSKIVFVAPGARQRRKKDPRAPQTFLLIPAMDQDQRIHVIYSGNVQGVGFRFTAERVASRVDVAGFVRNLPNGNVEVVCEGSKADLEGFLDSLDQSMRGYIRDSQVKWESSRGEFSSFGIRF